MSNPGEFEGNVLAWLLERNEPGVRYLTLRDLLDYPADNPDLKAARIEAHTDGPIASILGSMAAPGYWVEPSPGYYPKYRGSVWSIIMLAQLGAALECDSRIGRACAYILDHALTENGQFSISSVPSGTIDCLQGNLCWSLVELGCEDSRLAKAFEWMARSVTGEGIADKSDRTAALRYYAGNCGPLFACGANNGFSCAWGAAKVMLALGRWPIEHRTPLIERAIQQGVDFLFGVDPAEANYPSAGSGKPSRNWWKFGFPVFYVTDLLQIVEALIQLGYHSDPRLANALDIIRTKQDSQGRWALEYDYTGKIWVDPGAKKQPNKWVTWRALRVLKAVA